MKKILLLTLTLLHLAAFAQTPQWVSTNPENRKVILEEFTGHQCTWCPAGHKNATTLEKANPGRVFAINIHSGTYATTSSSYPLDLTTAEGDAIDNASGLTGYPAGSLSRDTTPWTLYGYTSWTTPTNAILSKPSPVNVAVRSNFDRKTGLMTTEVEVYYTSAGKGTSNRLHIWLLQDSIKGDQVGKDKNPTNITPDGQYWHNHVLRDMLQKNIGGDTITPIAAGTYKKFTYVTRLPSTIKNVPVDFNQLHVVAAVGETSSKLLNGASTKVTYDNTLTSLGVSHSDNGTTLDLCTSTITPKITLQNNSGTAITSFDMVVIVNGVETISPVTQSIPAGASANITLPAIPFTPSGNNNVTILGPFKINNGNFVDDDEFMDNFNKNFMAFKKDNYTGDHTLNIESTGPSPDVSNSPQYAAVSKASFNATYDIGAEGSTGALLIRLHTSWNNNKPNRFLWGQANIPATVTASKLAYHYAYSDGGNGGSPPYITVHYTENCGATWTRLDSTVCTETGQPAVQGNLYIPKSAEYIKKEIDILSLKGKSNVIFRVTANPTTTGNALYLDQISVKSTTAGGGGTGGGGSTSTDTAIVKVVLPGTTSDSVKDVTKALTLTKDTMYTWNVDSVKIPGTWSLKTICDNFLCYNYPATTTKDYSGKGDVTEDLIKVGIRNNLIAGYGYVIISNDKKSIPLATRKKYKFSMLVSASGGTVGVISSNLNEKILYYHENTLFIDNDFNQAEITVFDINGKQVMASKVNGQTINFDAPKGVYIANIVKNGEVVKTTKFDTSK